MESILRLMLEDNTVNIEPHERGAIVDLLHSWNKYKAENRRLRKELEGVKKLFNLIMDNTGRLFDSLDMVTARTNSIESWMEDALRYANQALEDKDETNPAT